MCDVVGVETQMLQVGEIDGCDKFAEAFHGELYRGLKIDRRLWKVVKKHCAQKFLETFQNALT